MPSTALPLQKPPLPCAHLGKAYVFPPYRQLSMPVRNHHCSPVRDLKAENVLLHNNGTWVLCDYGSTSSWSGHYEGSNDILVAEEDIRKHTTPAYRPPEVCAWGPPATHALTTCKHHGGGAPAFTCLIIRVADIASSDPADVRPVFAGAHQHEGRHVGACRENPVFPESISAWSSCKHAYWRTDPEANYPMCGMLQSLGVLLYYICFQQLPFQGDCKLQVT